ncbi:MAG TPA: hypothetical protein VMR62_10855 [Bryobacteraceae bacterium]|jgi:hypothetical protein|nr:hypothetical protein [Bryobacteraceae bacterium]
MDDFACGADDVAKRRFQVKDDNGTNPLALSGLFAITWHDQEKAVLGWRARIAPSCPNWLEVFGFKGASGIIERPIGYFIGKRVRKCLNARLV